MQQKLNNVLNFQPEMHCIQLPTHTWSENDDAILLQQEKNTGDITNISRLHKSRLVEVKT